MQTEDLLTVQLFLYSILVTCKLKGGLAVKLILDSSSLTYKLIMDWLTKKRPRMAQQNKHHNLGCVYAMFILAIYIIRQKPHKFTTASFGILHSNSH